MSIDSAYHRILSPVLRDWVDTGHSSGNPEEIHSTPVGILACQREPLLRHLDATVVSSILSVPPAPPKGKNTKKAVLAPTIPQDAVCLEVCLNDTVIFPEGGAYFAADNLPGLNSGRLRWPTVRHWNNYNRRWYFLLMNRV